MKIADADILILPGLGNSGPGHWQRRWGERFATGRFVEQDDWERPRLNDWVKRIESEIMRATRPVVLVAHSLGVSAVVHMAARQGAGFSIRPIAEEPGKVRGAFLVSPPDDESDGMPPEISEFGGVPRDPLPFPSMLMVSTNDVFCSVERALDMATPWGSELHLVRDAGHINVASGHGPWPEGLLMFTRLMQRLRA